MFLNHHYSIAQLFHKCPDSGILYRWRYEKLQWIKILKLVNKKLKHSIFLRKKNQTLYLEKKKIINGFVTAYQFAAQFWPEI